MNDDSDSLYIHKVVSCIKRYYLHGSLFVHKKNYSLGILRRRPVLNDGKNGFTFQTSEIVNGTVLFIRRIRIFPTNQLVINAAHVTQKDRERITCQSNLWDVGKDIQNFGKGFRGEFTGVNMSLFKKKVGEETRPKSCSMSIIVHPPAPLP